MTSSYGNSSTTSAEDYEVDHIGTGNIFASWYTEYRAHIGFEFVDLASYFRLTRAVYGNDLPIQEVSLLTKIKHERGRHRVEGSTIQVACNWAPYSGCCTWVADGKKTACRSNVRILCPKPIWEIQAWSAYSFFPHNAMIAF
jgi:hypothetical protein